MPSAVPSTIGAVLSGAVSDGRNPAQRAPGTALGAQLVSRGEGTSLEGHAMTPHRGVCLDLTRMDAVLRVHADDLDAVVFDEVHYINNPERGKVWEETLILLPPEIRLILLSATLAAPEAFAGWIGELKQRPCVLISTLYRVVPLSHYVIEADELKAIMGPDEKYLDGAYKGWLRWREGQADGADKYKEKVRDARAGGHEGAISGKVSVHAFVHTMNATINLMADKGLLPALMFVFSRKDCERYAGKVEGRLIDSSDVASVRHIVDFHLHRYEAVRATAQYHELFDLLQRGIGYHHSGLLPLLKEIVEMLFAKGLIKVLFCTETFAVGINMPTKTAVFLDYHKFDGRSGSGSSGGQRILFTDEYLQMAGRAGRRGLDKLGTVIYLPQRRPAYADEVKTMMSGSTRAITSRMDFHYDFLLKVMQSGSLNCLSVMRDSYWFKQRQVIKGLLERDLVGLREDYAKTRSGLSDADFAELSQRAQLEATLKASINAARKDAQRALGAWQNSHMAPKWENGWKAIPALKRLERAIEMKTADIAGCDELVSFVEPRLTFLERAGFITAGPMESLGPDNLTLKGVLATEVNESHSLLTAEVYQSGMLASASGEEILCVLASFINEKLDSDATVSVDQLDIPDTIVGYVRQIEGMAGKFADMERALTGGLPGDDHWALGVQWIEPVWRWLAGEQAQVLCGEYGMYAGNLLRTVLRIANVADEWISLATYCEHTEMVERMTAVKERILRDIAVSDSLYLRI
jgi:superfamily II RNA helicase